ncbi:MAG: metallophosphoesterase [Cellulosilyticaceae bacterium]
MKKFIIRLVASLLLIPLIGVGIVGYAFYIEPNRLTKEKYDITLNTGKIIEEVKVVQFSDVHLGAYYSLQELERLVESINQEKPDLVIFTGDLMDNPAQYKNRGQIKDILGKIESKYGNYAVWGNHDYGGAGIKFYEKIMTDSGFRLLRNEHTTIQTEQGQLINIIGLDDAMLGEPNSDKAFSGIQESQLNLLIMHEPDLVEQVGYEQLDLALAGHSHGGQIRLPFIGPLITPPLAKQYTHDLYNLAENKYLYVNSGIGTTKIPARFLNPPQIAIFNIEI